MRRALGDPSRCRRAPIRTGALLPAPGPGRGRKAPRKGARRGVSASSWRWQGTAAEVALLSEAGRGKRARAARALSCAEPGEARGGPPSEAPQNRSAPPPPPTHGRPGKAGPGGPPRAGGGLT
eukprot:1081459-Pyramimonas_sp.AAC.1